MTERAFAFIGFGCWGVKMVRNLKALSPTIHISTGADLDAHRRAPLRTGLPWIMTTNQTEDVLLSYLDGMMIATLPRTYFQLVKKAFLRRKRVLIEKAHTVDGTRAGALISCAEKPHWVLMLMSTKEERTC